MKHRKITHKEILLCLDRLTRFKHTLEKYPRVFLNIISKYSDADPKVMMAEEICTLAQKILSDSLDSQESTELFKLHKQEEENSYFQNEESLKYLQNELEIGGVLKYIEEDSPLNLKRLKVQYANPNVSPRELREKYLLKYPVEKVILCEGATEEILLEEIARVLGYDFNKYGIHLIGAGGKNQVARKYYKMKNEVRLPIFILLDSDAVETKKIIENKLRANDKIYIIKKGEFEDILPQKLILRALNSHFKNQRQCEEEDFNQSLKMTKNLKEVFRLNGFGDFKKSDFAKLLKAHIKKEELDGEILEIIKQIKNLV